MLKTIIKKAFYKYGFDIVRRSDCTDGFIDAAKTVKAAKSLGLSVCEYVEQMWGEVGKRDRIIELMKQNGCFDAASYICEIGPGTGKYLERIIDCFSPKEYYIYETQRDWADWLEKTYSPRVLRMKADGHTLSNTPNEACGLVHAHGVFVYLPFLNAFNYFSEMVRICAKNGYIVFDFFSEEVFDTTVIRTWLNTKDRYPVILPKKTVVKFFLDNQFSIVNEFTGKLQHSYSHYIIFKKDALNSTDRG